MIEYAVEADGYYGFDPVSVVLFSDSIFRVALDPFQFDIVVKLLDIDTGEPFWGATVVLNGVTRATDATGEASFTFPAGIYDYLLQKISYSGDSGSLAISSDTSFTFYLSRTEAYMKYRLTKEAVPVNGATVTIGEDSLVTDNLGRAMFEHYAVNESYSYTVRKEGYQHVAGDLYLVTDTTIAIEMVPVGDTSAIGHAWKHDVKMWPNPAGNKLFLEFPPAFESAGIVSLSGTLLKKWPLRGNSHETHLSGLQPGTYIVIISGENRVIRKKLIKL